MAQAASKTRKVFDNRYEILSIVGRGHCSVVYHARHVDSPSSEVALKVLLAQKDQRSNAERLRREALAMVSSRHRYVIRLDDFHSVGELCYLSMEYAPHSDLRKYTAQRGAVLDPKRGESFLLQMAEALAFIHKAGIIHRDIKPDNILVINDQEVRLGDFGVAVLPGSSENSLEELQRGVGTMDYMAPEVLDGRGYEARSDLYALAVTFYELLSGTHPFSSAPLAEQLEARSNERVLPLQQIAPKVPTYLAEEIMRAMRFDPADRHADMQQFIQELLRRKSKSFRSGATAPTKDVPKEAPAPAAEEAPAPVAAPTGMRFGGKRRSRGDTPSDGANATEPAAQGSNTSNEGTVEPERREMHTSNAKLEPIAQPRPGEAPRSEVPAVVASRASRAKTLRIDREMVEKVRAQARQANNEHAPANKLPSRPLAIGLVGMLGLLALVSTYVLSQRDIATASRDRHADRGSIAAPGQPANIPLTFPDLPGGVYAGTASGLIPGREVPLSVLSFAKSDTLVFIFGVEGMAPASVQLEAGADPEAALRVSSSGMVLDVLGQAVDGAVMGSFVNRITGEEGAWRIAPIQIAAASQD